MGISNNPKGRSLLHPEPVGRGASGHTVIHPEISECHFLVVLLSTDLCEVSTKRLEKQHLLNKMIVFQDALILKPLMSNGICLKNIEIITFYIIFDMKNIEDSYLLYKEQCK